MPKLYGDLLAQALAQYIHAPVANEAAITAIPADDRVNGQTVKAISEGTSWTYVAASTASGSSTVKVPDDAPSAGRWIIDFSTFATSVAGLAAQGNYSCASGLAAGDWVYVSAANTVAKADADDTSKLPCIGVIVSKPTSTTCVVQTTGEVTLSGLTAGALYYLSGTAGAITTTVPTDNAIPIGIAKSTTVLVILNDLAGAGDLTVRGKLNVAGTSKLTGAVTAQSTLDVTGAIVGSSTGRVTALGVGAAPLATGVNSAGPAVVGTFTIATLPSASTYARGIIWVSDASGGAKPCISDGTNWKIITLGSTVS
jgi:hypothetical protein